MCLAGSYWVRSGLQLHCESLFVSVGVAGTDRFAVATLVVVRSRRVGYHLQFCSCHASRSLLAESWLSLTVWQLQRKSFIVSEELAQS